MDDNRFNLDFVQTFLNTLDAVEKETDAKSIVVTSAHEKIFSNGLDLEFFQQLIKKNDDATCKAYLYQQNKVFKRLVTYPLITVAAISGHAFAMGAIICCAFDFRFMRSDRGYFCLPEVDLGIPFLPGMLALLGKAIPQYKLKEMQLTGIRLTANECEAHHIIQKACERKDLMTEAVSFAKSLNKKRKMVWELKKRWNKDILHAIEAEDVPYIEKGTEGLFV